MTDARKIRIVLDRGDDPDPEDVPEVGEELYRSIGGYAHLSGFVESVEDAEEEKP